MKFLYKLFSIFLFFVILIFIKQIAKDLSKNFHKSETEEIENLEKSRKSRKSVKQGETPVHEDIVIHRPGFVFEDVGEVTGESRGSSDKVSVDDAVEKPDNFQEAKIEEKLFDDETGVRLLTEKEMEAIENRNCCHTILKRNESLIMSHTFIELHMFNFISGDDV